MISARKRLYAVCGNSVGRYKNLKIYSMSGETMNKKIAVQFTVLTFIIMLIFWGGLMGMRSTWHYAR